MKRYFYNAPKLAKRWLESQHNLMRRQDQLFRDAMLAALHREPTINKQIQRADSLRESILNLTIEEQFKYANNAHLQLLFNHFCALHGASRGKKMVIRGERSVSTDLVDPDKFPIWDLQPVKNHFHSTWNLVMGTLRHQLGHQLIVRDSLVEHPDGGQGVFAVLPIQKQVIEPGHFLGFVPGTIFESYSMYQVLKLNKLKVYQRIPKHLHFPSGKILELSHIKYNSNQDEEMKSSEHKNLFIEPSLKNPYALGHMINHPPIETQPNVVFSEIELPQHFIPHFLYKNYLPNDFQFSVEPKNAKNVPLYGIFASRRIRNREQLYVNYCQSHIYPINEIPEWLIEPEEAQQNNKSTDEVILSLKKGEYENPSPSYWNWLERKALQGNEELYSRYKTQLKKRPGRVIFQNDRVKVRGMKEQN